jgi:hypothetical protein
MDAAPSLAALQFIWPAGFFRAAGLKRADFGVLGSTQYILDGSPTDVYLPVDVRLESAVPGIGETPYVVTIIPSVALAELYVSIVALDDSGRVRGLVGTPQQLKVG